MPMWLRSLIGWLIAFCVGLVFLVTSLALVYSIFWLITNVLLVGILFAVAVVIFIIATLREITTVERNG